MRGLSSAILGLGLIVGQPLLYAFASILSLYTVVPTSVESLVRPTLVLSAIAIASLLVARMLTKSWTWSGLLASAVVLFTVRELGPFLIIATGCAAWLIWSIWRRMTGRPPSASRAPLVAARASGVFSAVLMTVSLAGVGDAYLIDQPAFSVPDYALRGSSNPNIYVLLVDGYPRSDTLSSTFGIDTTEFLGELRDAGFDISDEARTNYNKTWLTLASALNGAYLDELLPDRPLPADAPGELRWLHTLINESSIPAALSEVGYRIRTVPSAYVSTALTTADDYVDGGGLTEFEVKLLAMSPWAVVFRGTIVQFLIEQHVHDVEESLTATVAMAQARSERPQFVLSHIHSPHTPFVLTPSGIPRPALPDCFPSRCSFWEARLPSLMISFDVYRDGLERQIETLNHMLITTTQDIVASDPEAIVIIMSDHGTRYSVDDLDEHYRSFLAARTPGHEDLFPEDESPVNVFRTLFSAYFAADLAPLPYRSWDLEWRYNLRLTERKTD